MLLFETHPTPNPNSLKITAEGPFLQQGMVSFNTAQEAEGHPLGRRLFALEGVINVFALPQFVTVTKHPEAAWEDLLPGIDQALQAYFDEGVV